MSALSIHQQDVSRSRHPGIRAFGRCFSALAILLVVVVVAQFYFAAVGGLSTAPREQSYRPHHVLGYVIFVLPLVMAVVAAVARLPRRIVMTCVLVAGLTGVQVMIAKVALGLGHPGDHTGVGPALFGLHAINGLAILATAVLIARRTRARSTPVER